MNTILKLYRYQALSSQDHFKRLEDYLNQRVWMTPLSNLNDPFERKYSRIPHSPEFILNNPRLRDDLLKNIQLNGGLITVDQFERRLNAGYYRDYLINSRWIPGFDRHGVLCLTRKNDNIPMWGYYADSHKGYCLEFELDLLGWCERHQIEWDVDQIKDFINKINQEEDPAILQFKDLDTPWRFVFTKVRYREKIPTMVFDDMSKLQNEYEPTDYVVKNSVGVKSIDWKHEDEFRLIMNGNSEDIGILPLQRFAPFLKITGIILGSRIEEDKRQSVYNLCQNKKISLYSASCSDSEYKITVTTPDLKKGNKNDNT